jgi:hypothetical protein
MKQLLYAALAAMVICIPVTSFATQASGPQHGSDQTINPTSKEAPRGNSATNAQTTANASGYGGSPNESSETSSLRPFGQTRALYSHH